MADERRRILERKAANEDQEAVEALAHARCQAKECCAHGLAPPSPPPGVIVTAEKLSQGRDYLDLDLESRRVRASLHVILDAPNHQELDRALEWAYGQLAAMSPADTRAMDRLGNELRGLTEPDDGDFCLLDLVVGVQREEPHGGIDTRRWPDPVATNAYEWAPTGAELILPHGLWRLTIEAQGAGCSGEVRLRGVQTSEVFLVRDGTRVSGFWRVRIPDTGARPTDPRERIGVEFRKAPCCACGSGEPARACPLCPP